MTAIQYENNPWEEDWWREKIFHPNLRRCVALTRGLSQIPSQKRSCIEVAYNHLDCTDQYTDQLLETVMNHVLTEARESLNALRKTRLIVPFDPEIHTIPGLAQNLRLDLPNPLDLDERFPTS